MYTRILTDVERRHVQKFLKQDGEKQVAVRKIVSGAKHHIPKIRSDLELLNRLLEKYR